MKPIPRWSRRKEARPAELTRAALELFVERGYAATRLDDVARRAGVSKGTLYLYFDEQGGAVQGGGARRSGAGCWSAASAWSASIAASAAELMRELVQGWWETDRQDALRRHPEADDFRMPQLSRSWASSTIDEVISRGYALIEQAVQRGHATAASSAASTSTT